MLFLFAATGVSIYGFLRSYFETSSRELSREFDNKSAEIGRELTARGKELEDSLGGALDLQVFAAMVYAEFRMAYGMWRMGNMWIKDDHNDLARTAYSASTAILEHAEDRARRKLTTDDEWQKEVVLAVKTLLVWLYAYLEMKDRTEAAYKLVYELEQAIEGQQAIRWEIQESCDFLRYRLPRWQSEKDAALAAIRTLLDRQDEIPLAEVLGTLIGTIKSDIHRIRDPEHRTAKS